MESYNVKEAATTMPGITVYENTQFGGKSLFLPAADKPQFYEYDLEDFGFVSWKKYG